MKIFFLFTFCTLFLTTISCAQPPQGLAKPGNIYGDTITADNAVPVNTLPGRLLPGQKAQVKISARVIDVCPKKGCWMKLQVNDSTTAFVKMKDYGFFVPLDIKGKTVIIEGESFIKETSVAELRHYAEDAKQPAAAIEAITQPEKEIRLTAKGIRVVS